MTETIGAIVASLTARFAAAGLDSPRLDARVLTADVLGLEPSGLFARVHDAFPSHLHAALAAFAERRLRGEPVSRIRGRREFYGREYAIGPATLDPRPDTETLIDAALQARRPGQPARVLDLGTGSGIILIAILTVWPEASGVGVDISPAALTIAADNARRHGVADRAAFLQSDWFASVDGCFDVIVSNPPYIADPEMHALPPEVARFDPQRALRGGPDGLDAYRRIIPQLSTFLAPDGCALFEVGAGQAKPVANLLRAHQFAEAAFYRDLAGIERVVAAARAPAGHRRKAV